MPARRKLKMLLEGLDGTVAVFLNNRLVLKDLAYRALVKVRGDIYYFGTSTWSVESTRGLGAKADLFYEEHKHKHRLFVEVLPKADEPMEDGEVRLWLQQWRKRSSNLGWATKFANNEDRVALFLFARRGYILIARWNANIPEFFIQRVQYPSRPFINPSWARYRIEEILSAPKTFNEVPLQETDITNFI